MSYAVLDEKGTIFSELSQLCNQIFPEVFVQKVSDETEVSIDNNNDYIFLINLSSFETGLNFDYFHSLFYELFILKKINNFIKKFYFIKDEKLGESSFIGYMPDVSGNEILSRLSNYIVLTNEQIVDNWIIHSNKEDIEWFVRYINAKVIYSKLYNYRYDIEGSYVWSCLNTDTMSRFTLGVSFSMEEAHSSLEKYLDNRIIEHQLDFVVEGKHGYCRTFEMGYEMSYRLFRAGEPIFHVG